MHAKQQDSETNVAARCVERWRTLSAKLDNRDSHACVDQTWPTPEQVSFFDALQAVAAESKEPADDIRAIGKQLIAGETLAKIPIAAVVGMLNSGKTSLVASFLSRTGQRRVLRGDANREGTHRFVLWVPQAWRDQPDSWSMLHELLGDVFGAPPEDLSDRAESAHAQYNNRDQESDRFGVPLLATDPSLDRLGLGLLDCPDVQSGTFSADGSDSNVRLEFVAKAARLCSAFIIVTSLSDARDGTLERITSVVGDRMPGVSRFMAVNRIRPRYTPAQVRDDPEELHVRHKIDGCFGAYNFEIPGSAGFTPPTPVEVTPGDGEPLPLFYELSTNDEYNPPAEIAAEKYLIHLAHDLDKSRLFSEKSRALWRKLVDLVRQSIGQIKQHAEDERQKSQKLLDVVSAATLDCMRSSERNADQSFKIHPFVTPAIARQLIDAITEQAPWYLKPGLWMNRWVRKVVLLAKEKISAINPVSGVTEQVRDTGSKIKEMGQRITGSGHGEVITPERLAHDLRAEGLNELVEMDKSSIEERCGRIIERFRSDNETSLDPSKLNDAVREMWLKVPFAKKLTAGVASLGTFVLSLGAALTLPVDMGASVLFAASLHELALAAGVSGVVTFLVGGKSLKAAEMEAGLIQLGDLFAIACDEFGLPRKMDDVTASFEIDGETKSMRTSQLKVQLSGEALVEIWRVKDQFVKAVNSILDDRG